jgi:hypothetical protein
MGASIASPGPSLDFQIPDRACSSYAPAAVAASVSPCCEASLAVMVPMRVQLGAIWRTNQPV